MGYLFFFHKTYQWQGRCTDVGMHKKMYETEIPYQKRNNCWILEKGFLTEIMQLRSLNCLDKYLHYR